MTAKRKNQWLLPIVLCAVASTVPCAARTAVAADEVAAGGRRFALLVGCTKYDHLPKDVWLDGAGNDVRLLRDLLVTRFGFPEKDIALLSEAGGADMRPTRANIERHFVRLADEAQAGDQVVVLLAGHGSQQPDTSGDELDGLDEVFCPADTASVRASGAEEIERAISDDQLGQWLAAIQKKGASVFIVFDSCHSGTAIRGIEKSRQLEPRRMLADEVLSAAARRTETTRGTGSRQDTSLDLGPQSGGLVAIYAARPDETTPEHTMPYFKSSDQYHGILTYALVKVLTEAQTPLTYTELVDRIRDQYVIWGRSGPTPSADGRDRHREVLGDREWKNRSRILLKVDDDGGYQVNAGMLHGLTEDSVLAVYPPAGTAAARTPTGYVCVTEAKAVSSQVEPCAYNDVAVQATLPFGGRCSIENIAYDFQKLKVAVVGDAAAADDVFGDSFNKQIRAPGSMVTITQRPTAANWLVWREGNQVRLSPASGWTKQGPPAARFGPVAANDQTVDWLNHRLQRIARANGLLRIASNLQAQTHRGFASSSLDVRMDLLKLKPGSDGEGTPIRRSGELVQVRDGDRVGLRLKNNSDTAVDVTVLYVDNEYGISSLFPDPRKVGENRLTPDRSTQITLRVNARTLGREHFVVLAVAAPAEPTDFAWLAQPSLERSRAARSDRTAPFSDLLQDLTFGVGKTRGVNVVKVERASFEVVAWETLPGK